MLLDDYICGPGIKNCFQVVDNDGVHAKLEKCSDVKLAAGEHQVKVMMFQAAKDVVLSATYRYNSKCAHSAERKD